MNSFPHVCHALLPFDSADSAHFEIDTDGRMRDTRRTGEGINLRI